jgi:hypothetical protein
MKPIITLCAIVLIIVSCKKEDAAPPPRTANNNFMKGSVTVNGRPTRNFVATADSIDFAVSADNNSSDTLYTITGWDDIGEIQLALVNQYAPGTYDFLVNETPAYDITFITYTEPVQSAVPSTYFSSAGTVNNDSTTGTFTIDKISRSEIEGTINVVYKKANEEVGRFDNVHFKGTFKN